MPHCGNITNIRNHTNCLYLVLVSLSYLLNVVMLLTECFSPEHYKALGVY